MLASSSVYVGFSIGSEEVIRLKRPVFNTFLRYFLLFLQSQRESEGARPSQLVLDLLGELVERFNIEVHAYVLMDNHYHLLLKTNDANLSRAMQWFGTSYTRKFNLKNSTGGHLFQGRFKSIIVENDTYLLRLSCYIHRNPVRAGIVERLADYEWSSYRFYAYKNKKVPVWLTTKTILNQLSGKDHHKAYQIKAQQYSDEHSSIWEDVRHGFIYGSQDFVADLKARFLDDKKDVELPQRNRLLKPVDSQLLLKSAFKVLSFNLESALKAKRIAPDEKEKRDMLIYFLWKTGGMPNKEIGPLLGVTYSTVSKVVSAFGGRVQAEKELRAKFEHLNSQFKV
jgi:REP element-mobilizing transposase RayT